MRAIKAFFLSRALREKLLLLAFIGIGLAIWLSNFSTRAGARWREFSATKTQLQEQALVLAQRAEIEASAAAAVERFVPSRTFNSSRLPIELHAIAQNVGADKMLSTRQPERAVTDSFIVNSVEAELKGVDWDLLKKFERELQQRSPYISLEVLTIQPIANGNLLNASFRVSSVEIAQSNGG